MWRKLRIGILLFVLAVVAWNYWYDRLSTTDWDETLTVGIYPIDETGDPATHAYVASLATTDVADIEQFLNEEAAAFGVRVDRPVSVEMFPRVSEMPPERDHESGAFGNAWWSLRMRMYARRAALSTGKDMPQIRIFVRFHNPEFTKAVPHSVGMQKGLVGVVHAFAARSMRGSNNVVIAHEILHTLGATDKYDPATLAPLFPSGYAEPDRNPRIPQEFAEIMAGRYPVSRTELEMPRSLDEVVVGDVTASEIRWRRE
ncbi:MAG TPA: hypothetical protein VM146_04120 [Steroidobacteraceae bacterium]|nr:hypothetical protein [Steroidobacteraceae bacterium]